MFEAQNKTSIYEIEGKSLRGFPSSSLKLTLGILKNK